MRNPFDRLWSVFVHHVWDYPNIYKEFKGLTFQQFLEKKVIPSFQKGGVMDGHWKPFYLNCDACKTNFTVISKMETFEEDKQKIGELTNWPRLIGSKDHVGARFHQSTSALHQIKQAQTFS